MTSPLRTVLIGLGKVGAGYSADPVMARHYPYATHAQVLRDHPGFSWDGVVDVDPGALEQARQKWGIPHVATSSAEIERSVQPEVAILATPPDVRFDIIEQLPGLKAVLVEKPLGTTLEEGKRFLDFCDRRGIRVQVNLWRRADECFRELAAGRLVQFIGQPQAVFGVYGNGLLNNGTHMVDFIRMLLGEIESVQTVAGWKSYGAGPIAADIQVAFTARLETGVAAAFHPVRFENYRENSLDIWGEKGRISILREGLRLLYYPRQANQAMQGEREIDSDSPQVLLSTVGNAFYHMYSNLAAALDHQEELWSPGTSALQTARVVDAIIESHWQDGKPICWV